jgi:hypothetical protein
MMTGPSVFARIVAFQRAFLLAIALETVEDEARQRQ